MNGVFDETRLAMGLWDESFIALFLLRMMIKWAERVF